jgi:hypothetical protein
VRCRSPKAGKPFADLIPQSVLREFHKIVTRFYFLTRLLFTKLDSFFLQTCHVFEFQTSLAYQTIDHGNDKINRFCAYGFNNFPKF